jgi:iron complex outermembrane receptor protein
MTILLLAAAAAAATSMPAPGDDPRIERSLDEEIVITGRRTSSYKMDVVQVGAFRNQSILDTPASIAVMPRALLDAQGATGLEEALRNAPGVTQQATSPVTSNNFVSRGVLMNARTNYRLNGALPIINLGPIPIEDKQRVELLKGVSALYYGLSTPSGIVNVVTKRAGPKPVTSITINGDVEGSIGGGFDIGRQFGADQRFGVRINAYGGRIETPIDDVNGHRYMVSGAFDWRATDRLSFKVDVEQYRRKTDEPGGLALPAAGEDGRIVLPAVPNPHNRYAPANAPYVTWVTNAMGRADYALSDQWSIRAEAGIARTRRQRVIANLSNVNLATGAGTIAATYANDQEYSNQYLRTEVAGKFDTFGIQHELLFGYTRNRQAQEDQHTQSYKSVAQNYYDPRTIPFSSLIPTTLKFTPGSVNIDNGLYAMDLAHIGPKWLLIGGARHVDYTTHATTGDYAIKTWTPTAGLVFRPSPKTSLYGTYIEGLESAGVAPDGTVNAGDILKPVVSKQWEIGARAELLGALLSVAWFHIDRGLAYTDATTNLYVVNGRAIHKGVEASFQGNLGKSLSVALAGQYLDATQQRTGNPLQNGKMVENTPKWSASAFAEYRPPALSALGVNAGVYYTGNRFVDALNRGVLPAYTTLSLGANYRAALPAGRTVVFRVNADNVTNKRYWSTGGATLYAGLARTVRMSATVDF